MVYIQYNNYVHNGWSYEIYSHNLFCRQYNYVKNVLTTIYPIFNRLTNE